MREVRIGGYFHIGALHWHLVRLPQGIKAKQVLDSLFELQRLLGEFRLPVTVSAGHRLWSFINKLVSPEYPEVITPDDAATISSLAERLGDTLMAEAGEQVTYVITEKRLDIKKLVQNPQGLLAPNVYDRLPGVCFQDFNAACRAIAFELPTAAAFLLLRCTEGTLRHYYTCNVKTRRLRSEQMMWGPMLGQLREKRSKALPELLDTLDRIRVNFRNPTNHPQKIYEIQEVQDLFGLCVDVINRMVQSPCWALAEDSITAIFQKLEERMAAEEGKILK